MLVKMHRTGPLVEPRRGPQAGKSGDPRSQNTDTFGLPSVASAYQHNLRRVLEAKEARHHAVLAEMETVLREPPEPREPPEAQGPGGS